MPLIYLTGAIKMNEKELLKIIEESDDPYTTAIYLLTVILEIARRS